MNHLIATFIGHRKIEKTEKLESDLYNLIVDLIENDGVTIFLFGSRSEFDALCLGMVTSLKEKYPHIKRIYVRGEYPYIDENYKNYILKRYDDTYFPETALNAGRIIYLARNREMIDKSDICVFYCDENSGKKGGAKQAFEYAVKKKKQIFNLRNE